MCMCVRNKKDLFGFLLKGICRSGQNWAYMKSSDLMGYTHSLYLPSTAKFLLLFSNVRFSCSATGTHAHICSSWWARAASFRDSTKQIAWLCRAAGSLLFSLFISSLPIKRNVLRTFLMHVYFHKSVSPHFALDFSINPSLKRPFFVFLHMIDMPLLHMPHYAAATYWIGCWCSCEPAPYKWGRRRWWQCAYGSIFFYGTSSVQRWVDSVNQERSKIVPR